MISVSGNFDANEVVLFQIVKGVLLRFVSFSLLIVYLKGVMPNFALDHRILRRGIQFNLIADVDCFLELVYMVPDHSKTQRMTLADNVHASQLGKHFMQLADIKASVFLVI